MVIILLRLAFYWPNHSSALHHFGDILVPYSVDVIKTQNNQVFVDRENSHYGKGYVVSFRWLKSYRISQVIYFKFFIVIIIFKWVSLILFYVVTSFWKKLLAIVLLNHCAFGVTNFVSMLILVSVYVCESS